MINLFTTYHQELDKNRSKELSMSLNNNILCKEISKIYLFSEVETKDFFDINGIKVIYHKNRPKFEDIFDLINSVTSVNDINIQINNFKADLKLTSSLKSIENTIFFTFILSLVIFISYDLKLGGVQFVDYYNNWIPLELHSNAL